jgi:hypothetical protein
MSWSRTDRDDIPWKICDEPSGGAALLPDEAGKDFTHVLERDAYGMVLPILQTIPQMAPVPNPTKYLKF